MRRAWWGRAFAGLAVATLPLTATACTTVVTGNATAAPPALPSETSIDPGPTEEAPTEAAPADPAPTPPPGPPPGPRAGLDADPVQDECLLNASEFGDLVGGPVRPPVQGTIVRGDGSRSSSCVATSDRDPVAMINIYTVRSGTPADYVRAGGSAERRELPGVGDAAVVVNTGTGPVLQLASPRYLVTILVSGRTPSDEAWRTAALAALGRLPE